MWACNNNTVEKNNSRDSLQNNTDTLLQPQSGNGQDKKDTAMYQRMPLKTNDSTSK